MSIPSMSGLFLSNIHENDIILDPMLKMPSETTQAELRMEIEDFEEIIAADYKFCVMVEGVSQESNLWVPRNQNETGLVDTDLQKFKNIAWNECVIRKFLTSEKGNVDSMGRSMINIIQTLNLQWKNLHIMGLHPKIEAAEKQVVMRCFEDKLLPFTVRVAQLARALRRCTHFSDFFANAVGSFVCHNTGRTPGLSKTMYGSDIDFAYKEKNYLHFASALRKSPEMLNQCIEHGDHIDYIPRLARLKIIKNSQGVNLQDYDTGKPQQPMFVGAGSADTNIDVRDILRIVETKMRELTENVQVSFVAERAQLLQACRSVEQVIDVIHHEFMDTEFEAKFQSLIFIYKYVDNVLTYLVDDLLPNLNDPTALATLPPPRLPAPPPVAQTFIQRLTGIHGPTVPVSNEATFTTNKSLSFTRNIRQRTTQDVDRPFTGPDPVDSLT